MDVRRTENWKFGKTLKKVPSWQTPGLHRFIDQDTHLKSKARRKNQALAWIDYKTPNYLIPKSWIIDGHKMYKIFDKVIKSSRKP